MSAEQGGIFGTDGVRGRVNCYPMTADLLLRLAMAAGRRFRRGSHRHRVIIGKDTRRSNYMIETVLTSGLAAMGMDVYLLGPLQTPGVAMLTRTLRADLGIMITASHNPYHDNGIKLLDSEGRKLSDACQAELEAMMQEPMEPYLAGPREMGHVQRLNDGASRYIEFAKATFPRASRLDGLKVVIDCANGAAYRTAPEVLWELGAEVVRIGVEPNGFNINENCGSTAPAAAQAAVLEQGADIGIALDGDADRVHVIDEKGQLIDGDRILGTVAGYLLERERLRGGGVVATEMSNLGLDRYLQSLGVRLHRTPVGDRNVIERMAETGCNLGGEQSGHVILRDYLVSGDGVIAALQVLAVMVRSQRPASEVCRPYEPVPQVHRSIPGEPGVLGGERAQKAIQEARRRLGEEGRLLVRESGTEPVVRIMAQGSDPQALDEVLDEICSAITGSDGRSFAA